MAPALAALLLCASAHAVELTGKAVQGGLIFGKTVPGANVKLDETPVMVSAEGRFVIGFGRDETGSRELQVRLPSGESETLPLAITVRDYDIERVDGLPPRTVTPDPEAAERIRQEASMVSSARARRDQQVRYGEGFSWPASGRISGVYGSQRVLNGKPRRPHFGLDIAAPTGSPVYAPADGIITLAHPDMYYSGGTMILDHGQGLSSTFLHLSRILVEAGTTVMKGDLIAEIGATGRASGPHLDWRMNWLDRRVDPQLLFQGAPPGLSATP
ncbi:MAG: M23 family metallopeptidase [Xanthomonadales bacterium]|nr:M23 family metallopeptidase [Gammaproteobacteria bacterium]MBT8053441.1 M23 family metallopeptidase [Gammaproteobacteria bacterium]NND56488.1 M23 family metallopeptidase [Xanthomonadales bacterium]NNK52197.1 M23 family metallopeptidase [Xanthomonadales bacterium]